MYTDDDVIRKNVRAVFTKNFDEALSDAKVEIRRADTSVFVKVTQMYEAPEHGLSMVDFIRAMCAAVGADEMEEWYDIAEYGCETCDYGSCYGTEFRFWNT